MQPLVPKIKSVCYQGSCGSLQTTDLYTICYTEACPETFSFILKLWNISSTQTTLENITNNYLSTLNLSHVLWVLKYICIFMCMCVYMRVFVYMCLYGCIRVYKTGTTEPPVSTRSILLSHWQSQYTEFSVFHSPLMFSHENIMTL